MPLGRWPRDFRMERFGGAAPPGSGLPVPRIATDGAADGLPAPSRSPLDPTGKP